VARAGVTALRVVEEAELLADEQGLANLSFAALAERLGVKVPSLYKHVTSLDAVRQAVSVRARAHLADTLASAAVGLSRERALSAIAHAYRDWAAAHPGRYETTLRAAVPTDAADVEASERAVRVIGAALSGYDLSPEAAIDATRMLRASLHGYVSLEAAGGYMMPNDLGTSFDAMVAALDRALASWE
jgi:AcrR family transcriptional regulator